MKQAVLLAFFLIPALATDIFGNCDDSCIKIGVAYPKMEAPAQAGKAEGVKGMAVGQNTASPRARVPYFKNVLELFEQQFAGKLGEELRLGLRGRLDKVEFVYREYTQGNN